MVDYRVDFISSNFHVINTNTHRTFHERCCKIVFPKNIARNNWKHRVALTNMMIHFSLPIAARNRAPKHVKRDTKGVTEHQNTASFFTNENTFQNSHSFKVVNQIIEGTH